MPSNPSSAKGATPKLRIGVIGLGRAFILMLPALSRHPRVTLVAAYDPRPEATAQFATEFNATAHASADLLCTDAHVDAVYVASPHRFHVEHVVLAAAHGKHVLVEKPMALSLPDAWQMIHAAKSARVHLLVGHSHSFDAPYLRTRELIAGGSFGRVRMITAFNATDFLYRPRRPEELDTRRGGGVVFSQAAHQVDVVRLLAGTKAMSVRAKTGDWDTARSTEGAYSALITFEGGVFATLTYSGYGHFDTDEFQGWVGELGQRRDAADYGGARRKLAAAPLPGAESALKEARTYGATTRTNAAAAADLTHNHFGLVIAHCDRGDLRPTPEGVMIYGNETRRLDALPRPDIPRREVLDELCAAVLDGTQPLHSGAWGLATLEICLAILQSAAENREITLQHQG